jgi:hypothetical protein
MTHVGARFVPRRVMMTLMALSRGHSLQENMMGRHCNCTAHHRPLEWIVGPARSFPIQAGILTARWETIFRDRVKKDVCRRCCSAVGLKDSRLPRQQVRPVRSSRALPDGEG